MASAVLTNGTARIEVNDFEDCDTLADLLDLYRDSLNIPADANIAVDGESVNPSDVNLDSLDEGAEVSATKTAGSKG